MARINQGEIWLADLRPGFKSEPGKFRPVLVIQNQILNQANLQSTIVIPLTTELQPDAEPLRIRLKPIGQIHKECDLLIDQIRALDNIRFQKGPVANIDNKLLNKVFKAVMDVISTDYLNEEPVS